MLRIVIYARVSTSDKGQDTENQLRELRQFVANKAPEGWTLAEEYVDQASGKNANRPEFQRLFRDAAERKFDVVLFWSLDRLAELDTVGPPDAENQGPASFSPVSLTDPQSRIRFLENIPVAVQHEDARP